MASPPELVRPIANAVLGIDTLWGGDVQSASGMGRFIADSWFSDEPLPPAYTHPTAAKVRALGGVSAKSPDVSAIDAYLKEVDVHGAIGEVGALAERLGGLRGAYLAGLANCFAVMWDLAEEILGRGPAVPYERCVQAMINTRPTPSEPLPKRIQVTELLGRSGHRARNDDELLGAVDEWRRARWVSKPELPALGARLIAEYDALAAKNVLPYLPPELAQVPRANVTFLPIENAWFSGSMNYLGRGRKPDGSPEYEATYEINAALEISEPELRQLVTHEVVPGHVTTFAFLQNLFFRNRVGFEATVLTMNTRAAGLFEGIANNAILMAHGVVEVSELPGADLQIGVLLALLQDDAKNQSSYLTWNEQLPKEEVARVLRKDYLVSAERADKLSGAWGRHPLLGRMYLPAYRAGTERVAELRRRHAPAKILPALFGCKGLVDLVTIDRVL
jgi:hypothetical protein